MSRTKTFLFERLAIDEPIKADIRADQDALRARLTVRIPTRRKHPAYGRKWDPLWPSNLAAAARELGIENVGINDGIFVATRQDVDRILDRATTIRAELDSKRRPRG